MVKQQIGKRDGTYQVTAKKPKEPYTNYSFSEKGNSLTIACLSIILGYDYS